MPTVHLADRALISVSGPDAAHFLQNLLTVDLDALDVAEARPGALLTPQGKIAFDFLISRNGKEAFVLECRAATADDFMKRLGLYRLRAKVEIELDQQLVSVRWSDDESASHSDSKTPGVAFRDRRFPLVEVLRSHSPAQWNATAAVETWHAFRIGNGVAESGEDYELYEAFPHDVLLDQLGGVGFGKGCYVGQEVVSRMQHRGTARRRVLIVTATEDLPPRGTEITAGGRPLGVLGSVAGECGLAVLRIDRVKDALDSNIGITAGDIAVRVAIPAFASFTFPASGSDEP